MHGVRMLKLLLSICCLSWITSPFLYPQSIQSYGFKVGVASATQSWDYHDTPYPMRLPTEQRWGIDAGIFIEVLKIPNASVLGELHYIQKGYSVTLAVTTPDSPEGAGYLTIHPRIDYLSIPVLIKLRYEMTMMNPYLFVGPRADISIGYSDDSAFDEFKGTDVGISSGMGVEMPWTPVKAILVEFRYSPSISNAYKGRFVTVRNRSWEFHLGVVL